MTAPLLRLLPALATAFLAATATSSTSTAATAAPPPDRPPRVLTSFLPVHSLTLSIAGSRARVENWLPSDVDPHEFQFSPRDLRRLREADLLIVGGLGLERWTEPRLREACGNPGLRLVEAAHGLPADALIEDACTHAHHGDVESHDHDAHEPNPHFWLDPLLAAHAATNILNALVALDPAGEATYRAKARETVDRLHALDREFAQSLAGCTATPFLTLHNAYPYLARRYGLRLVGVVETVADQEPSARELAALSELVRREGVRVLFIEARPTRLARQFASDLKLRLVTLDRLETGRFGASAYEDGMRRNLDALVKALQPTTAR